MNEKDLSERDICSKFIGPAVKRAGWDGMMQIREEVAFTKGRIIVRGKLVTRRLHPLLQVQHSDSHHRGIGQQSQRRRRDATSFALGRGFIQAHHTIPVSELRKESKTKVRDIALVCSNCHRMLHRRRPWLRIDR